MQSISENDFECFASTGVNAPGTMFPSSNRMKRKIQPICPARLPVTQFLDCSYGSNPKLSKYSTKRYESGQAEDYYWEFRTGGLTLIQELLVSRQIS